MDQSDNEFNERAEQILALLNSSESSTLEYLTELARPRLLAQIISAFANSTGGTLIIGVDDKGTVVGCEASSARRCYLESLKLLKPAIEPDFLVIKTEKGWIAAVVVEQSDHLVVSSGGIFVRSGEQIHAMHADEIESRFAGQTDQNSIHSLAEAIETQTETISNLQKELEESNSPRSKFIDYVISGLVGVLMGAGFTWLIGG